MSIIMAIDKLDFYYKPTMSYTTDSLSVTKRYEMLMVEKGQAMAFTYKMLHAGGPNAKDEEVFCLFAYIVCDEADYPPNRVFPETTSRTVRKSAARLDKQSLGHVGVSGRACKVAR
jgi:hypothetical protein